MFGDGRYHLLIKVFLVLITGTIAFRLLFNRLIGGDNMDHMGEMSGYGHNNSLDVFLGGLLVLLVKFLMVVIVAAVIVAGIIWIKNTFFKNTSAQWIQTIKNDPVFKTVSVITAAILGIILLFALLGSFTGTGFGFGSGGYHGGMYGGFNPSLSIAGILSLLIKVLSFVLVISLILALVAYLKKQIDQGTFNFTKTNPPGQGGQQGDTNPQKNQ